MRKAAQHGCLRSMTMDLTDLTNKTAGLKFVPPHCAPFRPVVPFGTTPACMSRRLLDLA